MHLITTCKKTILGYFLVGLALLMVCGCQWQGGATQKAGQIDFSVLDTYFKNRDVALQFVSTSSMTNVISYLPANYTPFFAIGANADEKIFIPDGKIQLGSKQVGYLVNTLEEGSINSWFYPLVGSSLQEPILLCYQYQDEEQVGQRVSQITDLNADGLPDFVLYECTHNGEIKEKLEASRADSSWAMLQLAGGGFAPSVLQDSFLIKELKAIVPVIKTEEHLDSGI
jgi:hypothetical protein